MSKFPFGFPRRRERKGYDFPFLNQGKWRLLKEWFRDWGLLRKKEEMGILLTG